MRGKTKRKRIKQSERNLKRTGNYSTRKIIRLLLILFFSMALSGNSCLYSVSGANEIPLPKSESEVQLTETPDVGSTAETDGTSTPESVPKVTDNSFGESDSNMTDSSFDGADPNMTDSSFDGANPNMTDSSFDGADPNMTDSSFDGANPNMTDSSFDGADPNMTDSSFGESDSNITDSSFDGADSIAADSSFDGADSIAADSSFDGAISDTTDNSPVENDTEAVDGLVTDSVSDESLSSSQTMGNAPLSINTTTVQLCTYAFYTGKAVCPKPVVSFQDTNLIENTDYRVKYSNNMKAGTATITIIGTGRYTGKVSCHFQIVNAKLTTKHAKYPYTGSARRPAAVITGAPYALQKNVDYTLSYKNNKKCGTATISLTGRGKWYGTLSASFTLYLKKLTLKSVKSPMNLRMVALWTPDKCVTGYQLRYEINGMKKTITMPGGNRQGKTLYQLPKDKICKVNVRSYLKQDGKTIYSSWSNTKSVKIRYRDWYVTQYESVTGNQAMIYAITDRYNRLILIDGGHTEDADQVRQIIRSHGNRVYAWILTHPHPDHIEAFNKIITTDKDIVVDQIYATRVNSKRYHETAQWYDEIDVYDTFCQIASKLDNVTYLKENDTFSCLGLTFKILHGWDSNVDALKKDLCNDGSLMFKVSGKSKSMLFCSDTQKEMQKFIYPGHKKELTADYVQCGHHGNWGLTNYFYSLVDADVAFMDAPPWLFINAGKYDAYKLRDYLQSRGTTVYRYDGKTHRVRIT